MRCQPLLFASGFFFLAGSVICGYLALPAEPEAFFAIEDTLDLGDLQQAQTVDAEFDLVNKYRKPVEITQILESCGCSNVEIGSRQLQAGQKTTLKVSWRTGASRGDRRVTINVQYRVTDDNRTSYLVLALRGNVLPDFDYEPKELVFQEGVVAKKTLTVSVGLSKAVGVISAYASHRAFTTLVSDGGQVEVEFDPTKWGLAEDALPHVAVRTNSLTEPVFTVQLKVGR